MHKNIEEKFVMRRVLIFSVVFAVLFLSACSSTPKPTENPVVEPTTPLIEPTQGPTGLSGRLSIAGSTTVQPLVEVLAEAFMDINPNLVIEVQGGGSSVGVTSAGEGTVDIGMASRAVKASEFEQFTDLQVVPIALDGIAIVTNPNIDLPSLSIEQVRDIFAGEITNFSEVGGPNAPITVVSREEGSGTRAAFEELVMEHGEKKLISENALLQQSNGQVRTVVATTPNTIAYLSFGFLDESTALVAIDGVEPTVDNVKNNSYPIARPLNMLTKGDPNELAQAFLNFILSPAGQEIVAKDYISVEPIITPTHEPTLAPDPTQTPASLSGKVSIAGSTTVQPLTEVLAEAFMDMNPNLVIEVQGGGSSVGVTSAGEGTVDIGMASRAIKGSEFELFPDLQVFTIALDGIAIVTNPSIELPSLSIAQVRDIFAGEITNFSEVGGPDASITVVSREEGSGTRAAFEELVMEHGEKKLISENALLQQSNGQVRTVVATTPNTIAYLSFGFLDDSTVSVAIDSVEPTVDNVKNNLYPIARPLNMLTSGDPGELAQAFLNFILSPAGQEIVAKDYISIE
jgi:phosphate transport system substrate-binding protein